LQLVAEIRPAVTSCGPAEDRGSDVQSYSGVIGDNYDALTDKFANLSKYRPDVKMIEYGKTVGGRPLRMIRIGTPAAAGAKRPAVLITEAAHGNEYLDIGYEVENRNYKRPFRSFGKQPTRSSIGLLMKRGAAKIALRPQPRPSPFGVRSRKLDTVTKGHSAKRQWPCRCELVE
jgi:hypothetical protein